MSTTKELLRQLVRNGQVHYTPVSEWEALTENQRERLIRQAQNTPPLTYSPVSLECKNLLRSYHAQGLLSGFYPEDLKNLTALEADFLIQCAENNRWLNEKSLFDYYRQTELDTAPAEPEQLSRIIKLSAEGHLRRLSSKVLLKLCHLSAKRLIWRGEMNRRRTADVSD